MLKIKDNIPLKELEKFGFENKSDYVKICASGRVIVLKRTKELFIEEYSCDGTLYDTIYDLIKADMVRKEVGKNEER